MGCVQRRKVRSSKKHVDLGALEKQRKLEDSIWRQHVEKEIMSGNKRGETARIQGSIFHCQKSSAPGMPKEFLPAPFINNLPLPWCVCCFFACSSEASADLEP